MNLTPTQILELADYKPGTPTKRWALLIKQDPGAYPAISREFAQQALGEDWKAEAAAAKIKAAAEETPPAAQQRRRTPESETAGERELHEA